MIKKRSLKNPLLIDLRNGLRKVLYKTIYNVLMVVEEKNNELMEINDLLEEKINKEKNDWR